MAASRRPSILKLRAAQAKLLKSAVPKRVESLNFLLFQLLKNEVFDHIKLNAPRCGSREEKKRVRTQRYNVVSTSTEYK
jgi:hypothetical protein